MNGYDDAIELMVLRECFTLVPDGGQVWIGCSTPDTGGYALLSIDPYTGIELKLFGWERVTPGSPGEYTSGIAALLRYTFMFDGVDWIWRRPFMPGMVPVAAHLVARILMDTWEIHPNSIEAEVLDVQAVDPASDDQRCNRCLIPECSGHR